MNWFQRMTMRKLYIAAYPIFFFTLACCLTPQNKSHPPELSLTTGGLSDYTIVIPPDADETLQFAAEELRKYLKEITGARLPVKSAFSAGNPFIRIDVKSLDVTDMPPSGVGHDAFAIRTEGDDLFIDGINRRSALFGVYHFLEILGCRWIAPDFFYYDGHHETIPRKPELKIPALDVFETARSPYRMANLITDKNYYYTGKAFPFDTAVPQMIDWCAKNKMNVIYLYFDWIENYDFLPELEKRGLLFKMTGHEYWKFLADEIGEPPDEFNKPKTKDHPAWLRYDKSKRSREDSSTSENFCTSNEEAQEKLAKNVRAYLEKHPEIDIFGIWANDAGIWCECAECEAQGSPGTRKAIMANVIHEAISEKFPDVKHEFLIYVENMDPPQAELPDDAIAAFAPIGRCYRHAIDERGCAINLVDYAIPLERWLASPNFNGEFVLYSYYRKMAFDTLPVVMPRLYSKELQWYHAKGLKGLSWYQAPDDWAQFELTHYSLSKMAWDCQLDVDELVRDYCRTRYGSAGPTMVEFYALLEETMRLLHNGGFTGLRIEGFRANPEIINLAGLANLQECLRMLEQVTGNSDGRASEHRWHAEKMTIAIKRAIKRIESIILEQKEDDAGAIEALRAEIDLFEQHQDEGVLWHAVKRVAPQRQIDDIKQK